MMAFSWGANLALLASNYLDHLNWNSTSNATFNTSSASFGGHWSEPVKECYFEQTNTYGKYKNSRNYKIT
jgi:hypothetical protein